jgi:tetratricopeptide (TPR) repeat protein
VKVLLPPKRSALLLLVAAAFAFRLTYLFQEAVNNPLFATPVVDAEVYTSWAAEILQGKIWWPDVRNYLPIYPAFIALCEVVGGAGPWPVKLTQSLLSSVAAMLMAVVVSRAFGRRAGILAGSLFALSWTLVLFDAERYSESLCVDALVGFLYLATLPERSRATSVAAGATLAIACACRLNLLPLVALGAATILWDPERFRLRVVHALAFVAIPVALVAAALGHNHRVSGSWMLRSQQSWNLYAAFDPEIGGLHPAAGAEFNKYMNRPIHAGMTTPGEQDGYWRRSAFTLLRTRPAAVLYNFIVRRSAIAVDDVEWSQEFDAYKYRNYSSLLSLPLPGFGWNLCLAAGGLTFLATRRFRTGFRKNSTSSHASRTRALLLALLAITSTATFIGKAAGRYRLPVLVTLIPFAGLGLDRILRRPRRGTALVVAGFAPVALLAFPDWADLAHRQTAHHEYFIGLQASREGRLVDAEQAYLTAIQAQAFDPDSPYELARLYAREGRLTNALSAVETALQREPDFWEALNLQASIALDLGQRALARSSIQRSLQQYSDQPDAWVLASELTFKEGDFTAWRVAAKQANVHGAGASFAREDALRLAERGRSEEAAAVLRSSSVDPRLTPADAASNLMLGCHIQLMEIADHGGAPSCWRELLTRFAAVEPVADQARFLLGELSEADYCRRARSAPNSVWSDLSFFNQGVNHLFRGQPEAARGAFAEYLARHPDATATPPTVPLRLAWDAVHPPAGGQPRP